MGSVRITRQLESFFASRTFFYLLLGVFVVEALWFVFSAAYPMPFDEDFHLGLIRLYSTHWLPFLSGQPSGADQFGAVARDPSYLYHYLMSFPYRTIAALTDNAAVRIIALRLLNVAMAAASLPLYAAVLRRAKASAAFVNVALGIFVLIPVVPQLAAHINYDNMLLLVLPLLCLSALEVVASFRRQRVDVLAVLGYILFAMLISIVKYASLPFVAAASSYMAIVFTGSFHGSYSRMLAAVKDGVGAVPRRALYLMLVLTALATVLSAQRYGVNVVAYHTPVPSCGQVLGESRCSRYSPWARDHQYALTKNPDFKASPVTYMNYWWTGMRYRLFFAIDGASNQFTNFNGFAVPFIAATVLACTSLGLMAVWSGRLLRHNTGLTFLTVLTLSYVCILWMEGYAAYRRTGQPVAINGRYLIPILPLASLVAGRAFSLTLSRLPAAKAVLATVALASFAYGGGALPFIIRSDESWYWRNNTVIRVNDAVRNVLEPMLYEGPR